MPRAERHRNCTLPTGVDKHMVPPDDDAEDQDLMLRIQRGDGAAFHRLGVKYRSKLPKMLPRHILDALCFSADGFAEVVQEFWERVLRRAHTWEPGRPVRPWLSAILKNIAKDHLNKETQWYHLGRYQRWWTSFWHVAPDAAEPSAPFEVPNGWDSDDCRTRLRALLLRCTDQDRRLIELYAHGVSDVDIAAELGITPGACRTRRHRIIEKLRTFNDLEP